MARTIIILAFGALPVLPIARFALSGLLIGLVKIFEGPEAVLMLAWGLAGIYGTTSLWLAAFNQINLVVLIGLGVGCVSIAPLIPSVVELDWSYVTFSVISPFTTALIIIVQTVRNGLPGVSLTRKQASWTAFGGSLVVILLCVLSLTGLWRDF